MVGDLEVDPLSGGVGNRSVDGPGSLPEVEPEIDLNVPDTGTLVVVDSRGGAWCLP